MQVHSPGQEDHLKEGMAIHASILAWRIHGQRSLAGYSPRGHKESDRLNNYAERAAPLRCRRFLYHLSHQEAPDPNKVVCPPKKAEGNCVPKYSAVS